MVDPIGNRPITTTGPRGVTRVQAPSPTASVASVDTTAPVDKTSAVAKTAASLAQSPPVDADRVAMIRRAIEEGRFPISPATIADNLIALKFDWISREPS